MCAALTGIEEKWDAVKIPSLIHKYTNTQTCKYAIAQPSLINNYRIGHLPKYSKNKITLCHQLRRNETQFSKLLAQIQILRFKFFWEILLNFSANVSFVSVLSIFCIFLFRRHLSSQKLETPFAPEKIFSFFQVVSEESQWSWTVWEQWRASAC